MLIYKGVLTIPNSGVTDRVCLVPDNRPIPANVSVTPTADLATFISSPASDRFDCTPGSPTDIPGIYTTGFRVSGTPGDTVSIAIYFPEMIEAPLVNVTASIPGTVNTDFGQSTAPTLLVNATGLVADGIMDIGGTAMMVVSVQDPPQQAVASGKGIPVKSEA